MDDLYKFLHLWVPHLYGDLEEMDYKSRGYELVESDTELWDEEPGSESQGEGGRRGSDEGELGELTRESWEVSTSNASHFCESPVEVKMRQCDYSYFQCSLHYLNHSAKIIVGCLIFHNIPRGMLGCRLYFE